MNDTELNGGAWAWDPPRVWSLTEDAVLREEYARGEEWEERAAARLPGRTAEACRTRGRRGRMGLRSTGYLRRKRKGAVTV